MRTLALHSRQIQLFPGYPIAILLSGIGAQGFGWAADTALIDFSPGAAPVRFSVADARAELVTSPQSTTLRVVTGHQQPWPGITLPAPNGRWDLSGAASIQLRIKNTGSNNTTIYCRADNPGADGTRNCVTGSLELAPGREGKLRTYLKRTSDDTLGGKLFGMRGYPVTSGGQGTIDPKNVTQLLVFVSKPGADHAFELNEIQATGEYTPPTASTADADPFFPLIDSFGQYRHKRWPGKVNSLADLKTKREEEAKELERQPGPKDWDKFGGWATGPRLNGTGFFRTQKLDGKWWLVDPDGRLFFSHGIDCVRALDATPIEERETWFEDFPGGQPEFAAFVSSGYALKGHYAGKTVRCFSFIGANLARKYGAEWSSVYPRVIHRRLRSWGLNTIANWSDESTFRLRLTPYTDTIGSGRTKLISGSEGYWGKFPDVFDASFTNALERAMESKRNRSANDPWCIGYFSDNEMSWGDELSLGLAALNSPPDQAAKQVLVAELQTKYSDIARLNDVWGTHHASWETLAANREAPDKIKAGADLRSFYTKAAEQYFRSVRDAIRRAAPKQLYLGCRFAWVNQLAAAAAAKYCDVVSYNLYQTSVADFRFNGGADVPLIIGEFHFGALDRGMFHTGLVPVPNQAARAQAYRDYVMGALRHPQFVGCHWFQYPDEPTTGRSYDEENYQIGFVDVADTPYPETIAASRFVGDQLYHTP